MDSSNNKDRERLVDEHDLWQKPEYCVALLAGFTVLGGESPLDNPEAYRPSGCGYCRRPGCAEWVQEHGKGNHDAPIFDLFGAIVESVAEEEGAIVTKAVFLTEECS